MQNSKLFSGYIYSNIVKFQTHLNLKEAWKAVKLVVIETDISDMDM
jgi:ABC-type bacteriocin/lantibiotic exporter with double-glycine peptidase domain